MSLSAMISRYSHKIKIIDAGFDNENILQDNSGKLYSPAFVEITFPKNLFFVHNLALKRSDKLPEPANFWRVYSFSQKLENEGVYIGNRDNLKKILALLNDGLAGHYESVKNPNRIKLKISQFHEIDPSIDHFEYR